MPRRVKQSKSILSPLMGDFMKRLGNSDQQLKNKLFKYAYWAISLFFIYSALNGTYGIPRIVELKLKQKALVESNQEELVKLIDGSRMRDLFKEDKGYIEYLARTRYHMVYPGETIYRYYGQ